MLNIQKVPHIDFHYSDRPFEAFSYIAAVKMQSKTQHGKMQKAFRDSITYQITRFKNNCCREGNIKCEICNDIYSYASIEIDHNSPTFIELTANFKKNTNIINFDVEKKKWFLFFGDQRSQFENEMDKVSRNKCSSSAFV